jgi:hypothetical protein
MTADKTEFEELNRFFEHVAGEVFGFVQACGVGEQFRAEQICLDCFKEATKRGDFQEREFEINTIRERILTDAFSMIRKNISGRGSEDHDHFFSLHQAERASLFLRHRFGLSFLSVARILKLSEAEVRQATHSGRQRILSRPMHKLDWEF